MAAWEERLGNDPFCVECPDVKPQLSISYSRYIAVCHPLRARQIIDRTTTGCDDVLESLCHVDEMLIRVVNVCLLYTSDAADE